MAPEVNWYLPAGHVEHVEDDRSETNRPLGHNKQVEDEAAAYWPAGQMPDTADKPSVAQNDPDGQNVQEPDPVEVW